MKTKVSKVSKRETIGSMFHFWCPEPVQVRTYTNISLSGQTRKHVVKPRWRKVTAMQEPLKARLPRSECAGSVSFLLFACKCKYKLVVKHIAQVSFTEIVLD